MSAKAVKEGTVYWLTGLSGAGKTTIAAGSLMAIEAAGLAAFHLDGDQLRSGLCSDLGFSAEDRRENVRRVAEVASLIADSGAVVLVALISPFAADRLMARNIVGSKRFREVHVCADLATCEARDTKGHYARARKGETKLFTGVSSPYENPEAPYMTLPTDTASEEDCIMRLVRDVLRDRAIS